MSVDAWARGIRDLVENQACRLCRIVHCKARGGSREEFLLVYVRHPSGKDAIVFVDRDTSFDPSHAYDYNDDHDDIVPPYSRDTIGSGMHTHTLGITPSRDRIRLSTDGTEASVTRHISAGWAEVHTVKFPKASEAPSVAHLAVLLTVVRWHVLSPIASAEMRSGWFAYCVVEVMREIFGGNARTNKKWVRVPYGGLKVESRDTVGALIQEFRSAWEDFSRRHMVREGRSTERKSKRQEERKEKKMQLDSLVHMLRAMNA